MRLDGRKGDGRPPWWIYHAEECRIVRDVVWIDDETNQWGEIVRPITVVNHEMVLDVHQARKIDILPARRLCIINPIEDADYDSILDAVGKTELVA